MAVSALVRQSEDKIARQEYQRRKDEIYLYNMEKLEFQSKLEKERLRAEQAEEENANLHYAKKLKNYAPHK